MMFHFGNVQTDMQARPAAWRLVRHSRPGLGKALPRSLVFPGVCATLAAFGSSIVSSKSQPFHHFLNTGLSVCYSLARNRTWPITLHSVNPLSLHSLIPYSLSLSKHKHDPLRVRNKYIR